MTCEYITPLGTYMGRKCNSLPREGDKFCEKHTPRNKYEVEFIEFLQDSMGISCAGNIKSLYDACFDDLYSYLKHGDTRSKENLIETVNNHMMD